MEIMKEICFWLIFSIGLMGALIGAGMLADVLFKRYMVYKEIYMGFMDFMTAKVREERKKHREGRQ